MSNEPPASCTVSDDEMGEMICDLISQHMPAHIAAPAIAWLDRAVTLIVVLRAEEPDLLKEFGL